MIVKTNEFIEPLKNYRERELVKVDSDNGFDQYLVKYVYQKQIAARRYIWRNKKTGECTPDHILRLHIWFYDKDWNYYPEGIKEEISDYELIKKPDNSEEENK